jgi:O-antigen/teichoic acid export membrane protein
MTDQSPIETFERLEPAGNGLRAATVKGTAWSYASFITIRVPALVTTIVLTRLVAPRDFGVIALGLVILTYLDALNEFGISSAVIYSSDDGDVELSVAFWLSMAAGVAAALLMTAFAIPLAAAFDEPRLRTVLPVLSLAFLLNSLGSVQIAVLKKRLQFRQLVPVDLARAALKAVVAISAAFAGWGVWSLVAGQLAGELAGSVAVWLKLRWRPSLVWDRAVVRRVLGYGSHIMGVGLIGALLADVDYLIVGRRLGSQQLGYYAVGFRLPEIAVMGICYAVSATMFPVLTRLRRDPHAMALGLAKSLRVLALLTIPIGVGIALTSRDFVATFYGERWAPTSRVMPFIAMYSVVFSITFVCGDVYKAVGRPGILMVMGAARFPLAVVALILVAGHGIVWVAATQLALMSTNMIVQMIVAHRVIGIPFSLFARSTKSAILAGAAMAVAIVAFRHTLTGFGPPGRFFISVAIGAVTYVAVALVLERSLVGEVADGLRSRIAS